MLTTGTEDVNLNPMSFSDQHGQIVFERLRYQRDTGRFCDVFINVGDKQFSAHRNVLAGCSPYFDAVFKSNKVVKEQVTISCKNAVVFELFLNYLYSGCVVIDRSSVSELLVLANNFLVTRLKSYCAEYLERYLDSENCVSVRELAIKYNLPSLVKAATKYFDVNINRCLGEGKEFLRFSLAQFAKLLHDPKYASTISPDVFLKFVFVPISALLRAIVRWVGEDSARETDFLELLSLCPLTAVSPTALHMFLDYQPLFAKSQMNANGLPIVKYESQFRSLVAQFGASQAAFFKQQKNHEENENFDVDEASRDAEDSSLSYSAEPIIEKPGLRIKISKKDKLGRKAYLKSIQKAKRRGRPPKVREPTDEMGEAIPEDNIDGIFPEPDWSQAVTYEAEDEVDPATVGDKEPASEKGGRFACPHCNFASSSREKATEHRISKHARNTVHVCPICAFEVGWNRAFYAHMSSHFSAPFTCDLCTEWAPEEDGCIQDLLNHRLTHSDECLFKCAECGYKTRTKSSLWMHERSHSGEKPHHCPKCGRGFNAHEALTQHIESHDDPRPFICDMCGFATGLESHLAAHRRQHTGDVFHCHIANCEYSSPKKSQLAAHLRTHMAVRAHICRLCNRAFIEKSHLVRHERIHLTDKPFKCENCDYASSRRDKLKEHIQKHHSSATASKQLRRRFKRARQLAQLAAQSKPQHEQANSVLFRPISVEPGDPAAHSEAPPQWMTQETGPSTSFAGGSYLSPPSMMYRSSSVVPRQQQHVTLSPSSMSVMNMNYEMGMGGGRALSPEDRLSTPRELPETRSPHHGLHSDPFNLAHPEDLQRPMSLPPYSAQQNSQQQSNDNWMWPQ